MSDFMRPHPTGQVAFAFVLALGSLAGSTTQSQALENIYRTEISQLIWAAPPNPPDQGSPVGRRQGGASRGPCRDYASLLALMPLNAGKVWGTTVSDRPTFWFYLPTSSTSTSVEFVVQDSNDNYVYKTAFDAPSSPSGIVSVSIPSTAPALEVNKTYSWTFSVSCEATRPSSAVYVQGQIYRTAISEDLQRRIAAAPPLEQAALYAANGVWQDSLTLLAHLRQNNPPTPALETAWNQLLQQADLGDIAPSPLISCCSPENTLSNASIRP
ncbi:MAG TPA: DUF928 domain-containing protein [Crinalium sp.]|jgi:hypothetical protein